MTALFAATIGIAQNDIKKVLAYSTVSQLGYMFSAPAWARSTAAIFHVMTHAFFKACLFLGAGSVIHGCGGEQDMRKMGGLRKYMPQTRWTMLIACIAIAGMPPLAGFFRRTRSCPALSASIRASGSSARLAATCTAFYMFRLYFMTFSGDYRGANVEGHPESEPEHSGHNVIPSMLHLSDVGVHSDKAPEHQIDSHAPHESPWSMTGVLWILAILAVIGGIVGIPEMFGGSHPTLFQRWLEPVLLPLGEHQFHFHEAPKWEELLLIASSVGVATLGWLIAYVLYKKDAAFARANRMATRFAFIHRLLENKYYVDEFYEHGVRRRHAGLQPGAVVVRCAHHRRHRQRYPQSDGDRPRSRLLALRPLRRRRRGERRRLQRAGQLAALPQIAERIRPELCAGDGMRNRPHRRGLFVYEALRGPTEDGHSQHRHLHPADRRDRHPLFLRKESGKAIRYTATFFAVVIDFIASLYLWFNFDPKGTGDAMWQFRYVREWIPSLGVQYDFGIDGISLLLILLTTFMGIIAVVSSFSAIDHRQKEYYILLLLLQTGMIGTFCALDFSSSTSSGKSCSCRCTSSSASGADRGSSTPRSSSSSTRCPDRW